MSKKTLENIAYDKIREKIVTGEYMPNSVLTESELASELEMSRTPIRSAISHLESEGFISSFNNRGIMVKDISVKEALDMYEMILSLQLYAINMAERNGYSFDLQLLNEYLNNQLEASGKEDYHGYITNSFQFRRTIVSALNNESMNHTVDSYRDKLIMKSMAHWKLTPLQKHYSANQINESVYHALQSGELEKARQELIKGFDRFRERVMLI